MREGEREKAELILTKCSFSTKMNEKWKKNDGRKEEKETKLGGRLSE